MPDINDKGVSIPIWMASIIFGVALSLMGWIYNQQAIVNTGILDALIIIKTDIRLNSLEKQYLIERLEKLESDNADQEKRLNKLERYHD